MALLTTDHWPHCTATRPSTSRPAKMLSGGNAWYGGVCTYRLNSRFHPSAAAYKDLSAALIEQGAAHTECMRVIAKICCLMLLSRLREFTTFRADIDRQRGYKLLPGKK